MAADERQLEKTSTPGIYRRGRRYVVTYRDPTGRPRKAFAPTLKAAKDLKAERRADVARGEYRAMSRITFGEYAPLWISAYTGRTSRGIGDRTLGLYRQDLGLDVKGEPNGGGAVAYFGRMKLTDIGPAEMKAYAKRLSDRGLAASTVKRSLAPVKALLATAHEERLIRFNPVAGVRLSAPTRADKEAVEKVKALTAEELVSLLKRTPEAWRTFFSFLAETGLRIGEALEVRWSDLDRGRGALAVDRQYHRGSIGLPKGRKKRRIPISKRMDAMLWEHRKETRAGDDELIFTAEKGARLDQKNLAARVLKPTAVKAGLGEVVDGIPTSWVSFHTFRHTAATMLFRRGWNAAQVSRFLGHSDAGFTLRTYVHLLDEDLPEPDVLDSLEAVHGATNGATQRAETDRNDVMTETAEIAV